MFFNFTWLKINLHNNFYHEQDKPLVSDNEFDKLIKENNYLEKKFPHLILENSPNKNVGGKASKKFTKLNHKIPMLSLSNAFNQKDLEEFIERLKKYLNYSLSKKIDFISEPKIDGLSINLLYKQGLLKSASTRGDGYQGENVIKNILTVKDIPRKLKGNNFPDEILEQLNLNDGRLVAIEKIDNDLGKGICITKDKNEYKKEKLFDSFSKFTLYQNKKDFIF